MKCIGISPEIRSKFQSPVLPCLLIKEMICQQKYQTKKQNEGQHRKLRRNIGEVDGFITPGDQFNRQQHGYTTSDLSTYYMHWHKNVIFLVLIMLMAFMCYSVWVLSILCTCAIHMFCCYLNWICSCRCIYGKRLI